MAGNRNIVKPRRAAVAPVVGLMLVLIAGAPHAATAAQTDAPRLAASRSGADSGQELPGSEDFNAGVNAAVYGRWQEALDRFRAVLEGHADGELADDAAYWRVKSLYELGRYEEAVTRANEFLERFGFSDLRADVRVVRVEAAEALVRRGNADYQRYLRAEAGPQTPPRVPAPPQAGVPPRVPVPAVAPAVSQASDPDAELRLMALDALIGMDPETAWPVLQRLVSESDAELRARAVWLLSQIDTEDAFELLVDVARNDPDAEVRGSALFWIGQSGEHAEQALELLIEVVNAGGDEEAVGQALFGLGQSESPRARDALETLARDDSKPSELRSQALFWLAQRDGSLELFRDILRSAADEELRGQALFGIAQINTPAANEVLLEIARSDAPAEERSNAIFWLSQRESEGAVDLLLELWSETEDIELRNQLLFGLAQTDTDRAVDHLVAVAKDPNADPELRQQAVFWLGQSSNPKAKAALLEIIGGGTRR